jgi:hypothetical protein
MSRSILLIPLLLAAPPAALAAELVAARTGADLSHPPLGDEAWKGAKAETLPLMSQPMAVPRSAATNTPAVTVQAQHDGTRLALRLVWADTERNAAGRIGQFSDGAAVQYPARDGTPPPVFMGAKDNPVHIYHWRAQYQEDAERGLRTMKDLYPNLNPDIYPFEFPDSGTLTTLTEEMRDAFAHGRAAGNPQSYVKAGVDEIVAEGFGSSSVVEKGDARVRGAWAKGKWEVVIVRPLQSAVSRLDPARGTFVAFAVWQGGKDEVGSRKSVTMSWTPLRFEGGERK